MRLSFPGGSYSLPLQGSAMRLSFPGGSHSPPMQGRGRGGVANLSYIEANFSKHRRPI